MQSAPRCTRVVLAALLAGSFAEAQSTERISVASAGTEGNGPSTVTSVSADGRYVAFESQATNLVANDTNGARDIFVRDRQTGTTERVSVDSAGVEGNNESNYPSISADGRYVAFYSFATNFYAGTTPTEWQVYVHDRQTGATDIVSLTSTGGLGSNHSRYPAISGDGHFVAFSSNSTDMVPGDTNGQYDVFVRDLVNGTIERVSVDSTGAQGDLQSIYPSISYDGRYVAFESTATNLVAGDTNGARDIMVRDRVAMTTVRVSVDSAGVQGNANSFWPRISSDGSTVGFHSLATNLVANDTNNQQDVFAHSMASGATERVSVDSAGVQGGNLSLNASLSGNGRFVAFESAATNLVANDTNGVRDIFVHDRQTGATELVSVDSALVQCNALCLNAAISSDARFVAFQTAASNLVSGDTNGVSDDFVRDRGAISSSTDLCQPGIGGVIACPCSNPPANSPRGCDNSAGTGGAQLTSSGSPSLSNDTLVFVTNGEKPTATSILLQGNAESVTGTVFGQGVRCAAGSLKRLYTKTASGGSITAPGPGDPSVSARAAALNQPITAGSSRWYAVYYRDPFVLGGCPGASTFNITQTQLVVWGS